jgi:dTDP-4-dehydrorhamnose 3,5-epimerase
MSDDILTISNIADSFRHSVSTQEYGKRPSIEGVRLIDLRMINDDSGSFLEIVRLNQSGFLEALPQFQVRQTSYSLVLPGAIKAFHLHFRQDDVWFVPPSDRLLVGLIDVRDGSPTNALTHRLSLGGGKAQLLFIPRGVGHGVANLGAAPGAVFYFVNQQFNIEDPDERRLPHDCAGEDFWSIQSG